MKFAVVVFPGSNCDADCHWAISELGAEAQFVWHTQTDFSSYDGVILPGGFSYGDYLRSGAIAHLSPAMKSVKKIALDGKPVIGICNGFQILLEAGMLPGAMKRNDGLKFVCKFVNVKTKSTNTPFTKNLDSGQVLSIPIAHNEGNYYVDADTLAEIKANGQIVFTYCDEKGNETAQSNPNGSLENIAGLCNKEGNILGMMPHPERAMQKELASDDGKQILKSMLENMQVPS